MQELGIDPNTLTPKMMIHVGRINTSGSEGICVMPIIRPEAFIGFGGVAVHSVDGEAEGEGEEMVIKLGDMVGWKVYQFA